MRLLITFILTVLLLSLAQAQEYKTVTGTVQISGSGERLPLATVYVEGRGVGTITNQNGSFSINIADSLDGEILMISYVGYQSVRRQIKHLPDTLSVYLEEALVKLNEVSVEGTEETAEEIFQRALKKIQGENGYLKADEFRLDGFYRELHSSNDETTGILECAIQVYDNSVARSFKDIVIPQFRKVYERKQNIDQFIETKEGHNHLLLLLNSGINLIPLAKTYKKSVWKLPLEIESITYFNDRLVYVLSNTNAKRELRVWIDLEDYSVYKNELILKVEASDHDDHAWKKVTADGEKCGAILDHQAYEYRKVGGQMVPYYFFRKFDFRCYDLLKEKVSSSASFSTELLINNIITDGLSAYSADRLKVKKGLINRVEPYDSAFWAYFNDIQTTRENEQLTQKKQLARPVKTGISRNSASKVVSSHNPPLKIGNHSTYEFTRADTLYGSVTPLLSCYDVVYYDLDVDLNLQKEWITGESKIIFRMKSTADKIRVDLFEGFEIKRLSLNDVDLTFERELDLVYINFDKKLAKDSVYTIAISYEGRPLDMDFDIWAGAFLWEEDSEGNYFAQSLSQGYGSKGWWPSKNHIYDEPDSASVSITVPSEMYAISNGLLQSIDTVGNDRKKYVYKVVNPINNYNIAVHVGNYERHDISYMSQNQEDLSISYYFLKQDRDLALDKLSMVPKMLEVYEKYFGPYPFRSDGFKIVQSPYPMEHQSCVAVGQFFDDQLILHETAHEWWGNSVSIADNADIWIHEAFATYAESLYIEETLGYTIGQEYLNAKKADIHNDHPIVGIPGVNHFHYRIEDKYFKGALILNMLRHIVDDDRLWFKTLLGIQEQFKYSQINTSSLLAYFNERLGKDHSTLFKLYLFSLQIPILRWESVNGDTFRYRWENVPDTFDLTVYASDFGLHPSVEWQLASDLPDISIKEQLESKYLIKVIMD
ncbi:MAG: M1 family aminopeptidase [Cyclobacteriaceae bacterium]